MSLNVIDLALLVVKTIMRVVHRRVITNISAIPDIFGEKNEICLKHPKVCLGYSRVGDDRKRIFRPDTGTEAKSGSGIAGNGMLFQNSGSG